MYHTARELPLVDLIVFGDIRNPSETRLVSPAHVFHDGHDWRYAFDRSLVCSDAHKHVGGWWNTEDEAYMGV